VLEDALHKSCAQEAVASGIPADLPVAGKSGTAYDFTDTWFIGYSKAVTCGVWVGFDKPQKIYRGAFGKDLALPVWASVMNSSFGSFPAGKLEIPPGLKTVEICRMSGLLPDKACYKTQPGLIAREYATAAQIPTLGCDVHGGGVRNYAKEMDQEEWPRAAGAVDLTRVRPVPVTAPTLLAQNDFYHSVNPALQNASGASGEEIPVARATTPEGGDPGIGGGVPAVPAASVSGEGEKEVRRAEPARAMDLPSGAPVITIPDPKPAEF
jgi:penicillin-binding protein 1A